MESHLSELDSSGDNIQQNDTGSDSENELREQNKYTLENTEGRGNRKRNQRDHPYEADKLG
ncbi:hypothetical protein [Halonotius sp. GCM10025705]|uniref:hypothetical protein n=1 Tax=Halonotius sp. GCM10025705 TaxID=3252678 RepID=UPI00361CECFE